MDLKQARIARNIGLRAMAKRMGISATYLTMIENGGRIPVCRIDQIEREYGVKFDRDPTNAELAAEIERLKEQLARAERVVKAQAEFLDGVAIDLHNRRCTDWYPEGAQNAALQMSEDMRLIGNSIADFNPEAYLSGREVKDA